MDAGVRRVRFERYGREGVGTDVYSNFRVLEHVSRIQHDPTT